jgi:hypothetical protein
MDYRVYIQTNHKQYLGALVAEYSLKRNSKNTDKFEVHIVQHKDYPFFLAREGQNYLRDGAHREWLNDDLQSFTLTRFMPPGLMGYQGRAVVIDPDVFAQGDVWELLSRDMEGKALMVRPRSVRRKDKGCLATSVMLLDCSKLTHWKVEEQFNAMFEDKLDYREWICLRNEDRNTVGLFEDEWNDFDKLTAQTKMLHTTKRKTQPWKTGLKVDFRPPERFSLFPPSGWLMYARRKLFGEYSFMGHYKQHPDIKQEQFFFGLVKEMLEKGIITEGLVREQMIQNHVRHDAIEVLERTPPLAPAA